MKRENNEIQKPERHGLQGVHISEVLGLAGLTREPVADEDWVLGEAYCNNEGTCESCQ